MSDNKNNNKENLQALPISTRLKEDYLIERILGQGGFGITYLAMDTKLQKHVAIKEFFPGTVTIRNTNLAVQCKSDNLNKSYQWALQKFIEEAKTLAKFHHENIVRVYRVFEANNTAYMVLEYVEGLDMEQWLAAKQAPPTQNELDKILEKLLNALASIHKNNIIHRDIKPSNIYIKYDGSPVLLDFGAAKYSDGEDNITTVPIVSRGFSPYECYVPEKNDVGSWTDIYSLSATLYFSLTKKSPPDALSRFYSKPDTYKPIVELITPNAGYRESFLVKIDEGLRNLPKDRPQSISEWNLLSNNKDKTKKDENYLENIPAKNTIPQDNRKKHNAAAPLLLLMLILLGGLFWINQEFLIKPIHKDLQTLQETLKQENTQKPEKPFVENAKANSEANKVKQNEKQEVIHEINKKQLAKLDKTKDKALKLPEETLPEYAKAPENKVNKQITLNQKNTETELEETLNETVKETNHKWDGKWLMTQNSVGGSYCYPVDKDIGVIKSSYIKFKSGLSGTISATGRILMKGISSTGNHQVVYKGKFNKEIGKGTFANDMDNCSGDFKLTKLNGNAKVYPPNLYQNKISLPNKVIKQSKYKWDGKWILLSKATSGCWFQSGRTQITIRSGKFNFNPDRKGRISKNGIINASGSCNSGNCYVFYKGKMVGNTGVGTYDTDHGNCRGTFQLKKNSSTNSVPQKNISDKHVKTSTQFDKKKWDGRWIMQSTAISGCWMPRNTEIIDIKSGKWGIAGNHNGSVSQKGKFKGTRNCHLGGCILSYKGHIKKNSGKGTFTTDHDKCSGVFTLRRSSIRTNELRKINSRNDVSPKKQNTAQKWDGKWLMKARSTGDTCSFPSYTDTITIKNGRMSSPQHFLGKVKNTGKFYSTLPCNIGACNYQFKGQLAGSLGKGTYTTSHDVCSGDFTLKKLS